jgi:hypothetical protein
MEQVVLVSRIVHVNSQKHDFFPSRLVLTLGDFVESLMQPLRGVRVDDRVGWNVGRQRIVTEEKDY